MPSPLPLSTIIALARAGDMALRAEGDEGRRYYLKPAEAYRRAAALRPATYPLINAATLSLLSGDRAQAEEIAREVLDRIARELEEPETPYGRAATEPRRCFYSVAPTRRALRSTPRWRRRPRPGRTMPRRCANS